MPDRNRRFSRDSDRGDGPRPIDMGVQRVMRHIQAPKVAVVQSLFSDWEGCVGELIATHSRPIGVADGTLQIEVDEPAWASELAWMTDELLTRISGYLNSAEITEISIKIKR